MTTFTITQSVASANLYLYPDGSSSTQFTAYGEAENYNCIDEAWTATNDDTDYVYNISATTMTDLYSLPAYTTETGAINYIRVHSRAKSDETTQASNGTFCIIINNGSTATSDNKGPVGTGYTDYSNTWTSSPSAAAWTWPDVNNLIIGVKCNSPMQASATFTWVSRPTADNTQAGDLNEYTVAGGINGNARWTAVDDTSPDLATRLYNPTTTHHSWFWMDNPPSDIQSSTIWKVVTSVVGTKTIDESPKQNAEIKCCIFNNGGTVADYWGTPVELLKDEYVTASTTTLLAPNTGIAWTWGDLENHRNTCACHETQDAGNGSYNIFITQLYYTVYYAGVSPELRMTSTYAVVNYQPAASTVTLTMPQSLQVSHGRQVSRHTFPTGSYEVDDYGRSGKTLTLSATETSSASATMQSLKDMVHHGTMVTVAGLPDSNLNTDYHIVDFNFQQEGGEVDIYRWQITLEED